MHQANIEMAIYVCQCSHKAKNISIVCVPSILLTLSNWWMGTRVCMNYKVHTMKRRWFVLEEKKMSRRSSFLLKEKPFAFLVQQPAPKLIQYHIHDWIQVKKKKRLILLNSAGIPSSHTTSRLFRTWLQTHYIKAALR